MTERRGWVRGRVLDWLFPPETGVAARQRQMREAGYWSPSEDISAAPRTARPTTGAPGVITAGASESVRTQVRMY